MELILDFILVFVVAFHIGCAFGMWFREHLHRIAMNRIINEDEKVKIRKEKGELI